MSQDPVSHLTGFGIPDTLTGLGFRHKNIGLAVWSMAGKDELGNRLDITGDI